jgi:hypothetical protein
MIRFALENHPHSVWHPCGDWGTPLENFLTTFVPEAFGGSGQDLPGEEDAGRLDLLERAEATGGRMAADEREFRHATVGTQGNVQRPWWQRWFGG